MDSPSLGEGCGPALSSKQEKRPPEDPSDWNCSMLRDLVGMIDGRGIIVEQPHQ